MKKVSDSPIPKARNLALKKHHEIVTTINGHKRPRVLHLQEVADLVWASGGSDQEIAAAWLHDIVEDTSITNTEIKNNFGKQIAEIVNQLTDPRDFKKLSLPIRKEKQAQRVKNYKNNVKVIKIADQISNIRALIDPTKNMTTKEWQEYLEGAKLIATQCRYASPLLDKLFAKTYREGKKILNQN